MLYKENERTDPYLAYSVSFIDSENIADRVARRVQTRAATDLLDALMQQAPATVHSKSHSRAALAVAIGNLDDLRLGIDIEWTRAARPIESIASYLEWIDHGPISNDAFYRGWTFAEAYFKAFQQMPARSLVAIAMTESAEERTIHLVNRIVLFQTRIFRDFQLSLVWKC